MDNIITLSSSSEDDEPIAGPSTAEPRPAKRKRSASKAGTEKMTEPNLHDYYRCAVCTNTASAPLRTVRINSFVHNHDTL